MRRVEALSFSSLLLCVGLACPTLVAAQSARAAHVVGLFVDQPAILVARDRALVPSVPDGAVTVCSHVSGACRPIRAARPCSGSTCPAAGAVYLEIDGPLADVSDYPTDRDGMSREAAAIASDPRVSSLYGALPQPPPATPPPTLHLRDEDWRFELAIGGGVGARPEAGFAVGSFFAQIGWGIGVDWDDEEILAVLFGNVLGADLRVRVLSGVLGASFDQLSVMVGGGARTLWAPRRERFRIGAGYLSLVPEVGVITHPQLDPAMYFGWSFPFAVALDGQLGIELRAWVYAIDDWIEGDEVAWMAGVDAELLVF